MNGNFTSNQLFEALWNHSEGVKVEALATSYSNSSGWVANTDYEYELVYNNNRITISINGQTPPRNKVPLVRGGA